MSKWFAERGDPTPATAWDHVYRLLLWIDRTTGLAHCYESDKTQPGRHWYGRSLAFHAWVASALGTTAAQLADEIDWLFKRATEDLATAIKRQRERAAAIAKRQREPYEGKGLPEPGEDPELVAIVDAILGDYLNGPVPQDVWRDLTERVRAHLTQENKRKNLVGEGFEDLLGEIIARVGGPQALEARTRVPIGDVPGFNPAGKKEKAKKVDLSVVNARTRHRRLITAKWSIRADREEQFVSDFQAYTKLESESEAFDYTLITNEFDAARLLDACERRVGNQLLFTHVVHVNPEGILAAYGAAPQHSAENVVAHVKNGRLMSLSDWLVILTAPTGA